MAEDQKRPEATHRQRADLGHASLPIGDDGRPMAVISCSASDLIPTVQFGNVLIQATITRAVPDRPLSDEELKEQSDRDAGMINRARSLAKMAEFVVAAERRIIQWAIDPSSRVVNPTTGAVVTPNGDHPAEASPVAPDPGK